jgi:ubiquitin-protein ligase
MIYHPNIDLDGAVCLGLRKPGAWKPVMDLKYVRHAAAWSLCNVFIAV